MMEKNLFFGLRDVFDGYRVVSFAPVYKTSFAVWLIPEYLCTLAVVGTQPQFRNNYSYILVMNSRVTFTALFILRYE